jgi:hypothetical protein
LVVVLDRLCGAIEVWTWPWTDSVGGEPVLG